MNESVLHHQHLHLHGDVRGGGDALKTFATLFSGGEGVGVGLQAAGLAHLWGVEYDSQIAAVAQGNGFDVTVADVRAVDYAAMPRADWLHASPSCTRASVANANAAEAQEDIEAAQAVCRALAAQQPDVFTLENVWQYRTFAAFRLICDQLDRMGYIWTYDHVNAADYGVPQTRRRLILRAARGLLPHLPTPVPWVGWYAAIEDLIPTLPESKLAPWQLARLPEELRGSVLVGGGNTQLKQVNSKARQADEPMFTVTSATKMGDNRAVLVPGLLNSDCTTMTTRDGDAWSVTVTTSHNQRDMRAVLVDIANTSRDATVIEPDAPAMTVQAWHGRRPSQSPLAVAYRVVSMTPRALARFQSVPDAYRLPDKRTLAARVIGNMVPPLLMQRIAENMLEALG